MILVNVYCVEMNQAYDFKVDETVFIEKIIEDMVNMIASKEHLTTGKQSGGFMLYEMKEKRILSPITSLAENGIQSGDELCLV